MACAIMTIVTVKQAIFPFLCVVCRIFHAGNRQIVSLLMSFREILIIDAFSELILLLDKKNHLGMIYIFFI